MDWLQALPEKHRRGSLPRCLRLLEGPTNEVAGRLTELIGLSNCQVSRNARWWPQGIPRELEGLGWDLRRSEEAKLGKTADLLSAAQSEKLLDWWLEHRQGANVPNWDIVSTCMIDGRDGLLLVEAKAHASELSEAGKPLPTTQNGWANHRKIGRAIADASCELQEATGKRWALSRDSHYQLSNRFAWAWKLASMGTPVVLMYLGFLNAEEMRDCGEPFADHSAWEALLQSHAREVVPCSVWDATINAAEVPLLACIRSVYMEFAVMSA